MRRLQLLGWTAVGTALCALAVPWFLWGDSTVVAGLPLWLWWHVGWMGLASVVFWTFAQRAWGIGIEPGRGGDSSKASESETSGLEHGDRSSRPAPGGDRP
ncbi:hypothetical protein Htur_3258 [Haloterrigena turkmenica DSM 5511]|uniref:DUF3311 domain-containing protein n=1 Tax=Haloterrigena turkmenica (strain ATCC 51198 / DSM 5511 / JCM 9101 / NCIMB 13204 / VKM B-1734 / 4k) TaxID=543526 RepID=D2RZT3_HALTV|nr:DUF3311 domain-containing protein [Haloterrigena turkmenica]ADB62122.1 hypothetical protein Htur_3258 [Haloterrigena turkmenica DSM 5511]